MNPLFLKDIFVGWKTFGWQIFLSELWTNCLWPPSFFYEKSPLHLIKDPLPVISNSFLLLYFLSVLGFQILTLICLDWIFLRLWFLELIAPLNVYCFGQIWKFGVMISWNTLSALFWDFSPSGILSIYRLAYMMMSHISLKPHSFS